MTKPGYMLIQGDAGSIPLKDKSVHCVVTSPPYFNQRDYSVAGQIGLEPTPHEYVEKIVGIFREVRRVLRDDGVLMLNLGDGYSKKIRQGIPHRVALGLQADGWCWRDEIVWEKPNPMPESVNDRTTKAHEFVFLLTKSGKYFYDAEAIKEDAAPASAARYLYGFGTGDKAKDSKVVSENGLDRRTVPVGEREFTGKRNARSVWKITSQAYKGAHFACMPPKLAARLIQAGSSEHGACSECGAPYKRNITKTKLYRERPNSLTKRTGEDGTGNYCPNDVAGVKTETTGWKPSCKCDAGVVPSTVLDVFGGSGTTVAEANRLGRSGIMMDLNADYLKLAEERIKKARIKAGLDVDAERYPLIAEIERRREAS